MWVSIFFHLEPQWSILTVSLWFPSTTDFYRAQLLCIYVFCDQHNILSSLPLRIKLFDSWNQWWSEINQRKLLPCICDNTRSCWQRFLFQSLRAAAFNGDLLCASTWIYKANMDCDLQIERMVTRIFSAGLQLRQTIKVLVNSDDLRFLRFCLFVFFWNLRNTLNGS